MIPDIIWPIYFLTERKDRQGFWSLVDTRDWWTQWSHMWHNVGVLYRHGGFN